MPNTRDASLSQHNHTTHKIKTDHIFRPQILNLSTAKAAC